jgi:hypothetical protein
MTRVTYVRTGDTVSVNSWDIVLVYDGKPWPLALGWAGTLEGLEQLRRENPDIEFVHKVAPIYSPI